MIFVTLGTKFFGTPRAIWFLQPSQSGLVNVEFNMVFYVVVQTIDGDAILSQHTSYNGAIRKMKHAVNTQKFSFASVVSIDHETMKLTEFYSMFVNLN